MNAMSYKGTRRKPTEGNKRLKAATVAGGFVVGGVAVPMTFAGSAQASTIDQWDKIAYCEADGIWDRADGDRDSTGGLQFRTASWETAVNYLRDEGIDVTNYDGPEAYKNTKGQQILAGEALLAEQGPGAWAVTTDANGAAKGCTGLLADGSVFEGGPNPFAGTGLTLQEVADGANVDNGTPAEPEPEPEIPDDPGYKGSYTVKAGDSLASIADEYGVTWELLYAANLEVVGDDPDLISVGMKLAVPKVEEEPEENADTYTVVAGDTLYDIAKEHGIPGQGIDGPWANLYAANVHVVGDNPNLIFPGQNLTLDVHDARGGEPLPEGEPAEEPEPEPEPEPTTYTVKAGDSLTAIAEAKGLDWRKLYNANKDVIGGDPDVISVGMKLTLDVSGAGTDVPEDEPEGSSGGYGSPLPGFSPSASNAYGTPGNYAAGVHTGSDYAAPSGTPVLAAGPGVVQVGGEGAAYGNHVKIAHPDGTYTLYAHLSVVNVSNGATVSGGTVIGKVGSTGNSTGPHLHFEARNAPGGYWDHTDPQAWLNSH